MSSISLFFLLANFSQTHSQDFFYTLVLYGCSSCSLITGLLIDDVYTRLIWVVYFPFFRTTHCTLSLILVTKIHFLVSVLAPRTNSTDCGGGTGLAWRAPVSQLCSTTVRLLYSRASCGRRRRLSGCRCSPFLWWFLWSTTTEATVDIEHPHCAAVRNLKQSRNYALFFIRTVLFLRN